MGFLVCSLVAGFVLSIVFQLAHTVEHTHFPQVNATTGKMEDEWAIHQIKTTANFATKNKVVSWLVGGLNFQVEHHLFPKISHIHYPAISKIIRKACEEYGKYRIRRSILQWPHRAPGQMGKDNRFGFNQHNVRIAGRMPFSGIFRVRCSFLIYLCTSINRNGEIKIGLVQMSCPQQKRESGNIAKVKAASKGARSFVCRNYSRPVFLRCRGL